jgi:hypothetical protein
MITIGGLLGARKLFTIEGLISWEVVFVNVTYMIFIEAYEL